MNERNCHIRCRRLCAALAAGALALTGFLLLLGAHPRPALADPDDLFVEQGGAGDCSQANPCSLQTALGSASHSDTIYVAGGIYTGTGAAVVTVTQNILLYGGWDGSPTGAVVRDPGVYRSRLDGESGRRGVYISGDVTTPTIDGFMIIQGDASATPDAGRGAGIYSVGASATYRRERHLQQRGLHPQPDEGVRRRALPGQCASHGCHR